MGKRVFDSDRNIVTIRYRDVISVIKSKRRNSYLTKHGLFFGPAANLAEEAELHADIGMVYIDAGKMINMNFIDKFTPNGVIVNGVFYPMSRRKLALLKSQLRK